MRLFTKNGMDFYEVASLLQKSLRRGDPIMAAGAANELFPKYANYIWNRLMTVSAEDCASMVTGEIVALYDAWFKVNGHKNGEKGRVFIAKAIVLLAKCKHSRDADELNILVADRLDPDEIAQAIKDCLVVLDVPDGHLEIPSYVYDIHTRRGKRMGATKQQFLIDEHEAVADGPSIFRNFDAMVASGEYVPPELDLS